MPGSHESSSAEDEDAQSDTSTLVYDQEPFETYSSRVRELVHNTWPVATDRNTVVERLKGGGYNRIIGISMQGGEGTENGFYILRVPRFENAQLIHDLTPLQFVHKYSNMPVPEVVAFDCTEHNVLGSPYMIQRRIRGSPLIDLHSEMDHEMRCRMARQLGDVFNRLTSLRSQHIGRLTSPNHDMGTAPEYIVQVLDGTGPMASWPYSDAPANKDAMKLLIEIFEYRESLAMAKLPADIFRSEYMRRFAVMTSEIGAAGYLKDVPITLCHLDFEPRNILIDLQDQDTPVSGILDWDSAVFAPGFSGCKPPMWIWAWKDEEDEDERRANKTPSTREDRELKGIFEQAAGQVYAQFAYGPVYRLARRLVQFAFSGIGSNEDCMEADSMLKEWSALRQESD